jgi:hypothetical protein
MLCRTMGVRYFYGESPASQATYTKEAHRKASSRGQVSSTMIKAAWFGDDRERSSSKAAKVFSLVAFERDRGIVVTSSLGAVGMIAQSQRPKYQDDASRGCRMCSMISTWALSSEVLLTLVLVSCCLFSAGTSMVGVVWLRWLLARKLTCVQKSVGETESPRDLLNWCSVNLTKKLNWRREASNIFLRLLSLQLYGPRDHIIFFNAILAEFWTWNLLALEPCYTYALVKSTDPN